MKTFRIIVAVLALLGTIAGHAQFKEDEYHAAIDTLELSDIREALLQAPKHGLKAQNYWSEDMEMAFNHGGGGDLLKTQANEAYLQLIRDLSTGVVNPETMGSDVKLKQRKFLTPPQLKVLVVTYGNQAVPLMESFAPRSAPYLALKEALHRISDACSSGSWGTLPDVKKELRLGSKSPLLSFIKNRMRALGYVISSVDENFDQETLNAVNNIQSMLRRIPDGKISPRGGTWRYLNVPCQDRMQQISLDMEKMRWFPQQFEDRYILINLAMTYFSLVDKTKGDLYTMTFRTINGRAERKSPTMMDKIVYIIINPYWVVPPTIFREDKVEEIRKLMPWEVAGYFQTRNYEVWNKSFTRRIDPTSIDWWRMDPNLDAQIYIRQKPNYFNALGVLKFMMTNSYAIYLHDTNQRELFAEPQRLLSSGCVRVERPMDLAEYLLQGTRWTREVIERTTAKPGQVLDSETRVSLKQPIPVYMVFLTSQLSSDGVIRFSEDTYNQGKRMRQRGFD